MPSYEQRKTNVSTLLRSIRWSKCRTETRYVVCLLPAAKASLLSQTQSMMANDLRVDTGICRTSYCAFSGMLWLGIMMVLLHKRPRHQYVSKTADQDSQSRHSTCLFAYKVHWITSVAYTTAHNKHTLISNNPNSYSTNPIAL